MVLCGIYKETIVQNENMTYELQVIENVDYFPT